MQFRRGKFHKKPSHPSSITSSNYSDSMPTTVSQMFATFWTTFLEPKGQALFQLDPGQNDGRFVARPGHFETLLKTAIQRWRMAKFSHFLVNIDVWPATTYEPDPYEFDTDTQIKLFGVSSANNCLFQGSLIIPFKNISEQITVRHHGTWISLETWLLAWISTAQSSVNVDITEAAASYSLLVKLDPAQTAIAVQLPTELQFKVWDYIFKDCDILSPLAKGKNIPNLSRGLTPSPKRRAVSQIAVDAMLQDPVLFVTDFNTALDWQFSRVFTQYLFYNNVVEFTKLQQIQDWVSKAPLAYLNDLSHVRLCLTKDHKLEKQPPHSGGFLFDSLAALGCRVSPDWYIGALAYLPSLKTIEIYLPPDYDSYSPQYLNANGPCRVTFTNLLIDSLFPWVVLPGLDVVLTGAVRTSQKARFDRLLGLARQQQASSKSVRFLVQHQRAAIHKALSDHQCSVPHKWYPRTETDKNIYSKQITEHSNARKRLLTLVNELTFGLQRMYVHNDSVTTHHPKVARRSYFENM
jgi:hypothetical protein